jgi:hypothetical protein
VLWWLDQLRRRSDIAALRASLITQVSGQADIAKDLTELLLKLGRNQLAEEASVNESLGLLKVSNV